MIVKLYTVRDHLINLSLNPWAYVEEAAAIRSFLAMCASRDSVVNQNPADFSLQCVGEMDTETGVIVGYPQPTIVYNGSSYVSMKGEK